MVFWFLDCKYGEHRKSRHIEVEHNRSGAAYQLLLQVEPSPNQGKIEQRAETIAQTIQWLRLCTLHDRMAEYCLDPFDQTVELRIKRLKLDVLQANVALQRVPLGGDRVL